MSTDRQSAFLLFLTAFAGTLGCSTLGTKQPPADLCVATANCMVGQASNPDMPAEKKQDLREQARKAYEMALKQSPDDLSALKGLAELYVAMENFGRAVELYRKAIEVDPQTPGLHYDLAMCHARHKDWAPAVLCLKEAVSLDPNNHKYGMTLGFTQARAGMYADSLVSFRNTGMSEPRAHLELAKMMHHLKQDEQAISELGLALKQDPNIPGAPQLLAQMNHPIAREGTISCDFEETKP